MLGVFDRGVYLFLCLCTAPVYAEPWNKSYEEGEPCVSWSFGSSSSSSSVRRVHRQSISALLTRPTVNPADADPVLWTLWTLWDSLDSLGLSVISVTVVRARSRLPLTSPRCLVRLT